MIHNIKVEQLERVFPNPSCGDVDVEDANAMLKSQGENLRWFHLDSSKNRIQGIVVTAKWHVEAIPMIPAGTRRTQFWHQTKEMDGMTVQWTVFTIWLHDSEPEPPPQPPDTKLFCC